MKRGLLELPTMFGYIGICKAELLQAGAVSLQGVERSVCDYFIAFGCASVASSLEHGQ